MNQRFRWLGLAAAATVGITACGGGGGDSTAGTAATPSATADTSTIESFRAYQATLPAPETIDPATLQKQLAPIDDRAEPIAIN